MFNKQNKSSLSEYWNSCRNGQGCNGTGLRLVPLQPWPLRYSFQYSDNDVLLDNTQSVKTPIFGNQLFLQKIKYIYICV